MRRPGEKADRSIALFLLAVLLFSPQVLSIFSHDALFFGLPPLFAYLFAAWSVIILAVGWSSWREQGDDNLPREPLSSGGAVPGLDNVTGVSAQFVPEHGLPSGVEPRESSNLEGDAALAASQQTMNEEAVMNQENTSISKEDDLSNKPEPRDAG
ncbi:hypothetical protein [Kiloniella laminariae]|uniref:hypothetical protein n=1 Tax=Kiloniella laminariae TaxID=454162 RepID=UPI00035DCCF3|nr:hypothetical protein [Kiloniella laminariae]